MLSPRKALTVAKESGLYFFKDDAMHHAAAISFYAAFSLAPMLMVTVAVASMFIDRDIVQEKLFGQFGPLMGDQGRELIATMLEKSSEPKKGVLATVLGILAIILGASGTFAQLKAALNTVWQVAPASGFVRHERVEVERPGPAVSPADLTPPPPNRPADETRPAKKGTPRGQAA